MHNETLHRWQHSHVFDQDRKRAGENRTLVVVALTAGTMVIEIAAGVMFGSMALLADGLHMASHATALGIAVFAYAISRKLATDRRFTFGVGKINSLAGFASAVLLLGFALVMAVESIGRLFNPLDIAFDQALVVAVLGLFVNGLSAWVLMSTPTEPGHGHAHIHGDQHGDHHGHDHDHNLRAAYLHVLADALTSLLAIVALLAGKLYGAGWLDPVMGIVGAALVTRWSYGLIVASSRVLLDCDVSPQSSDELRRAVERDSTDRVADVHYWSIGHGIHACELTIVSHDPAPPEAYKSRIPAHLGVVHSSVEVHRCHGAEPVDVCGCGPP